MKDVLVIGDTHGNHIYLEDKLCDIGYENGTIFHVGDFGVGFTKLSNELIKLEALNKFLADKDIHMYVIRGNHDKPSYFDGTYESSFSHLHLMLDYSVITIGGNKFLMVGGAISVDRIPRIAQNKQMAKYGSSERSYWIDEKFVLDPSKLEGLTDIKYVITHSSPHFAFPINDFSNIENSHGPFVEQCVDVYGDTKLKNDLNEERIDITNMYNILKENGCDIKYWFMGHFHTSEREVIDGCEFILLNINEIYELKLE